MKTEDDTTKGTRASPESEKSPATGPQGMCQREAYCLLVRVAHNVDSVSALDAKVPDYVWMEAIAQDICAYRIGAPPNTFVVELLSDTEFLLFQGPRSGPGMAWEDTILYIWTLHDIQDWGGTEVTVIAGQHTMRQSRIDLANTRDYRRARILGRLTVVENRAKSLALDTSRPVSPQGQGQGYTQRADRYYAQKAVGAPVLELTLNAARPATPEDYHSAREPSKFEYESEGLEGTGTDSTGYSSTATATSHHDTDGTQCSNTKNHDWRRQKQKHRDRREHRKMNAWKQQDRRNGQVVLPLFWESTKEGALTYTDWRLEVEEYIAKKYPRPKIKEAMFTSLEGKAKPNFQTCDERGDLSPEKILEKMDMIYGTSVSFQDLNAKLCGLKQGAQESPKDYYEQMVDISVALKEYHGDRFQPGELAQTKKQCFFKGLRENYKYLVSHLKDQDDVDLVLMLKEIRECDELQYPANTSHPPKSTNDGPAKNTNYYDKKNYDRWEYGNYTAWAVNVPDEPDNHESDSLSDEASEKENDDVQQNRSYHVGVTFTADEGEAFFGKCYNCGEPGHPWTECKKPMKPALRMALKAEK